MKRKELPLKKKINFTRLCIHAGQKLCVVLSIVAVIGVAGTVGAVETNQDLFYGIIGLMFNGGLLVFSWCLHNILEDVLFWEFRKRMEEKF